MSLNVHKRVETIALPSGAQAEVAVLDIQGRIESTTIQTFQEPLEALLQEGPHNVVLNFSEILYISSTGLGGLFKYAEVYGEKGGTLSLVEVPEEAHHVIHMLGVDSVVPIFETLGDAINHIANERDKQAVELTEQQRRSQVRSEALSQVSGAGESGGEANRVLLAVPKDNIFSVIIANKLKAAGIEPLVATSVDEALELADKESVSLAVVDFMMPDHEKLAHRLKLQLSTGAVSLLMIYSEGTQPMRVKSVDLMSNEYIVEPFDLDKLINLVKSELERHRTEAAILDHEIHFRFPTESDCAAKVGEMFKEVLGQTDVHDNEKDFLAMTSACREAVDNACRHGNKWDEDKFIDMFYILDKEKLTISVKDQGSGFNWKEFIDRAQSSAAKELAAQRGFDNLGGLGIALMMRCVDSISYNDKGNIITLVKGVEQN